MNVYMIADGDEATLWKAETMYEAVKLAEDKYIADNAEHFTDPEEVEREHYRTQMVESCTKIGELENP